MNRADDRTERFVPGEGDAQTALEHLLRYEFAATLCRKAVVLDLACGEGYGSALVARDAERVIGIDVDEPTVAAARERYGDLANVEFQQGDAEAIRLPDASVDCVVAFEMIEHVTDPAKVVAEVRRVLRPDGLLLVSTPNAPENPDNLPGANPYHLHAFDEQSFDALLAPHFGRREYLGERVAAAATLWPIRSQSAPPTTGAGDALGDALGRLGPTYLVALASNGAARPPLEPRWKLDTEDTLLGERIAFWASAREANARERQVAKQLEARRSELEELTARLLEAGHAAAEAQAEVATLRSSDARLRYELETARGEAARAAEQADYFRAEATALRESYESIVQSASWRVTKPLRRVRGSDRPEGT